MSHTCDQCFAADCPCPKKDCPMFGKCVECVAVHRKGKHHVPHCLQEQLSRLIAPLAAQAELKVERA